MVTEPIRDKKQLQKMAGYWLGRRNYRNYTLIVLGAYTALRLGDLLRLLWSDVYDESRKDFRSHISVIERKTGKLKIIALNANAKNALRLYLPHRLGRHIFISNRREDKAIGRVQAWRIIKAAAQAVGITGRISAHSLRKTFGYFAWKSGVMPVMLMDLYNHSSYEVTKRYLGIAQEDRDRVYLGMELF